MTQSMLALVENAEPSDWTTDPAQLNFTEYRNRQLWGPPDQAGKRQCLNVALLRKPFSYTVEQRTNPYTNGEDPDFGTWDKALDLGRSCLVGAAERTCAIWSCWIRRSRSRKKAAKKIRFPPLVDVIDQAGFCRSEYKQARWICHAPLIGHVLPFVQRGSVNPQELSHRYQR